VQEVFNIMDDSRNGTIDANQLRQFLIENEIDCDTSELESKTTMDIDEFKHFLSVNKTIDRKVLKQTRNKLTAKKHLAQSSEMHMREGRDSGTRLGPAASEVTPTSPNAPASPDEVKSPPRFANTVSRYGRIKKKSGSNNLGWQTRTLCLDSDVLRYYKPKMVRPMGEIELKYISRVWGDEEHSERFYVEVGSRTFNFKATSANEADEWVDAVNVAISAVTKEIDKLPKGKFWKVEPFPIVKPANLPVLSYYKSLETLSTGDIVLFQTKGIGPGIIRSATSSQYDHVGLFIRRGGRVGVLEALGESGVMVSSFVAFYRQNWHDQYSAIVVRKVVPALPARALKEMRKFCRGVEGKKYSLTAGKLMRRNSTLRFDDEKRTYFCSELVAKAFKTVLLLRADCPSTEYYPGSFGQSERLPLLNGYRLGDETLIKFPEERYQKHKKSGNI